MTSLFQIRPGHDMAAIADTFARTGRAQIRDFLEPDAARNLHRLLVEGTEWHLAWQAGHDQAPAHAPMRQIQSRDPAQVTRIMQAAGQAVARSDYGFVYASYPIVKAYLERWAPGSGHDALIELINEGPFVDFVRQASGMPDLIKADAQATLFAPQHFLATHIDAKSAEGWRVAYVLSLCDVEWKPDWGGYLLFMDEDGDVTGGFRPRFNALNIFAVPTLHNVSYVAPFAPVERFAITGWVRDR